MTRSRWWGAQRAVQLVPALALALALAACGTPSTTAGSPTRVGEGSTQATDGAGEAEPASIPAAPPPQQFVDRAAVVAEAVRAAGLPKPASGIYLESPRVPGLGFETVEQKAAWARGRVTIEPGVRLGAGRSSRIAFAGGSSRPVEVLDARAALTAELPPRQADCDEIHVGACELTVTGARLVTADVVTSVGAATVPAWSFTVDGLAQPIVVVAVSPQVLKTRTEPSGPPGLPEPGPGFTGAEALKGVDEDTLTVNLTHGACDPDLRGHVVEFDDLIVVGGTHGPLAPDEICPAVAISSPSTLTLARPLGDRPVISAVTGTPLRVRPPLG